MWYPLNKGVIEIDDEDLSLVSAFNWNETKPEYLEL